MDDSISFGDVEETQPDEFQRPDQNYHYAVVPVGKLTAEDLPIYFDLDTALEIETHAQENTEIELGGVLLGGQYLDDQGNPFVLIRDSLRAEDYEATRSSFKFTHETWEKISRQKDRFPPGTEIVGWYHTHPDWGVFLSGMDMFICNGFFNRPLDVALVVDPCRDQRSWFHWETVDGEKVKREANGFYLYSSRFRQEELELTAHAMLSEEGNVMVTQQRMTPVNATQPVIHVHQPDNRFMGLAVLSMLMMQTAVIVGAALWFGTQQADDPAKELAYRQVIAELLPGDNNSQQQATIDQLLDNQQAIAEANAKVEAMARGSNIVQDEHKKLQQVAANFKSSNESLLEKQKAQQEELKELRKVRNEYEAARIKGEQESLVNWWTNWVNLGAVALVAVGIFFGGMITAAYRSGELGNETELDSDAQEDVAFEDPS